MPHKRIVGSRMSTWGYGRNRQPTIKIRGETYYRTPKHEHEHRLDAETEAETIRENGGKAQVRCEEGKYIVYGRKS